MFKVGDIIVAIKNGYMLRVGTRVKVRKVLNDPEGVIRVIHLDTGNPHDFAAVIDNFVLEETYNSPLYEAMRED